MINTHNVNNSTAGLCLMEERVFTYKLSMHRKEYFLLPRDYQGKRGPLTKERVFTYKLSMHRKEYFLLPRDYQGKRGPLTKVIPLKLFLDRVSTSSENDTRALRGCFRGGFVVTSNAAGMPSFIEISNKQRRFYPSYVLKHNKSLPKH